MKIFLYMKNLVLITFILSLIFSCNFKQEVNIDNNVKQKQDTTLLSVKTIKPIPLNSQAKKIVSEWNEYQNIQEFIPNFYKTDTKQALFDSQRILELSKQLKDSIRIDKFNIPSFRARLHVLYNESLRLADMDSIKSITQNEVVSQTKNIVQAFDAINSKINMLVSQENLEENLKEFDSILNKKDSTKKEFKPFLRKTIKNKKSRIKRIKRIIPLQVKHNINRKKTQRQLK